jgi:integrase
MAIYDRWHKSFPRLDDTEPDPELNTNDRPCKCGTAKRPLYPTAEHPRPVADGQRAYSGGKRWQVRYDDAEGKAKRANFRLKDGEDPAIHASAFERQVEGQVQAGTYTDPKAGRVSLETFATQWRANLTASWKTLEGVDNKLGHIIDLTHEGPRKSRRQGGAAKSVIGKQSMAQLARTPSAIQAWVKSLESKGLSASYIHLIAGTLSTIFDAAVDDGVVVKNPLRAKSVTLPAIDEKRVVPWTLEQILLAAKSIAARSKRDESMVFLGAEAALRQGEIFGFAKEDIEFLGGRLLRVRRQVKTVNGVLVFGLPKGGKERTVPLSDDMSFRLASQIETFPPVKVTLPWNKPGGVPVSAELLYVRAGGTPWDRGNFNNHLWRPAREAAGVPQTRENGMHVLRHTFASACLAAGVDIKTLSIHMGHSNIETTLRYYAWMMPDASERTRNALHAFFNPPAQEESALNPPSGIGTSAPPQLRGQ